MKQQSAWRHSKTFTSICYKAKKHSPQSLKSSAARERPVPINLRRPWKKSSWTPWFSAFWNPAASVDILQQAYPAHPSFRRFCERSYARSSRGAGRFPTLCACCTSLSSARICTAKNLWTDLLVYLNLTIKDVLNATEKGLPSSGWEPSLCYIFFLAFGKPPTCHSSACLHWEIYRIRFTFRHGSTQYIGGYLTHSDLRTNCYPFFLLPLIETKHFQKKINSCFS